MNGIGNLSSARQSLFEGLKNSAKKVEESARTVSALPDENADANVLDGIVGLKQSLQSFEANAVALKEIEKAEEEILRIVA